MTTKKRFGPPAIAALAVVGVMGVVAGGAVAYRQEPQRAGAGAAPLAVGVTPSPRASSSTPSASLVMPTPKPSVATPPLSLSTGPVEVPIEMMKLRNGAAPRAAYLVDRVVRDATGWVRTVPDGTDKIDQVVRVGDELLAMVSDFSGGRLIRIAADGESSVVSGVSSLVGAKDGSAASLSYNADGRGTIRYEKAGSVQVLVLPAGLIEVKVLAVANGKIYYHWQDSAGRPWKLFEWTAGAKTPRQLATVPSANVVSSDAMVAGSTFEEGALTCTTLTLIANGRRLWRSCGTEMKTFTPNHAVTVGTGDYLPDDGSFARVVAQDTATGKVIHEWTGTFDQVVAEDDQHLLMAIRDQPNGQNRSIVRCAIRTGSCETAVRPTDRKLALNGFRP